MPPPPGTGPIDPAQVSSAPATLHATGADLIAQMTSNDWNLLWFALFSAVCALAYGFWLRASILKRDTGSDAMREVAAAIQAGSRAYLKRQGQTLAAFILGLVVILWLVYSSVHGPRIATGMAIAFLGGAICSFLTGYIGMMLAVEGNVRVAAAALTSFKRALETAFQSGAVAGMMAVGMGLFGAVTIFMVYKESAEHVLLGFGFGCALVALFMRVGGGIFTKAADVGADLVGKVENSIPEDDPRNPATIADNVGDNVGDCAGMAADVFESYSMTIVAAVILGAAVASDAKVAAMIGDVATHHKLALHLVIFPLLVNAVGIFASIIGINLVKGRDADNFDPMQAIQVGFRASVAVAILGFLGLSIFYLGGYGAQLPWWKFFAATLMGIVLAVAIERLTNYYTATDCKPVEEIANSAKSGPATLILSGIAYGLESSTFQAIAIAITIFISYTIFNSSIALAAYGVALAGLGLLTTTGFILAMDTYGPISDNANGIFEMSGALHDEKGNRNEKAHHIVAHLDAVGNTTKALTKGFAIATAVIAAVSLFSSFIDTVSIAQAAFNLKIPPGIDPVALMRDTGIRINYTDVFVGFLVGGAVPFLFSSFAIRAVGRSAFQIVEEVRRQFRERPGIMLGTEKPDYSTCVDIVTAAAQRELLAPAILGICTPIAIGFGLGAPALGGFLAGAILTGQLLAVFMSTSGGAWDNAKKKIEDGMLGGKGTDYHKASVIGDTVGDPFKDTAGPALNPLIKVMNLVAILIAPLTVANMSAGAKYGITAFMVLLLATAFRLNSKGQISEPVEELKS